METNEQQPARAPRMRRSVAAAGLVGSGLLAGAIIGGMHIAGAATPTPSTSTQQAPAGALDPRHGAPGETLLTGTTAAKVRAAALKAIPGATVIRVETDSEGSPYEAHLQKADGSLVTVKVDKNFKVTETDQGMGRGGPHRPADQNTGSSSTSTTNTSA